MFNLGRVIYFDFLHPVKDYWVTLKLKEITFDWILPTILSLLSYFVILQNTKFEDLTNFNGYVINFLAILIGFSITCLTILSTSSNENVSLLKSYEIDRKIGNKRISLYQFIFITFSFALIMELVTLVFDLVYFLYYSSKEPKTHYDFYYAVNTLLMYHIICLNIRNVTNFYHIFWKDLSK